MNGLAGFTNAFLLLYALDAGLSLLEELLRGATGTTLLLPPRQLLAFTVVLASLAGLPLLALTPKLPARLLLPLFGSALWLGYGAAPLPLWLGPPDLGLLTSALQCLLARLAFVWVRRINAARGEDTAWWLDDPAAPVFSAGHTLGASALGLVVGLPLVLAYSVLLFVTVVQVGTREFVSFDREGILLADRHYERDDRRVRLVGMMHVGEGDAYREIVESFRTPSTVVLEEGVTDANARLESSLEYGGVARALGLESQGMLAGYLEEDAVAGAAEWPVWRHADVDLQSFAPETVEWLAWAQSVWSSDDWLAALGEILRGASNDPALLEAIERDVFTLRNEHLLEHLEAALPEFERVVVPWGALHLPALETAIEAQGFVQVHEVRRHLVAWSTVRAALAERSAEPEAAADPGRDDGSP